jgi:hypothetical protein
MGMADFQGSADCKPLDRSTPTFESITAVLTSCYIPTFITFAPKGSSAQYGEVAHNLFASFISLLVTSLLRNAPVDCQAYASNDVVCHKEVPFGGLIDEKNFSGGVPFPRIFKGHFTCKSKKSNNF